MARREGGIETQALVMALTISKQYSFVAESSVPKQPTQLSFHENIPENRSGVVIDGQFWTYHYTPRVAGEDKGRELQF